MATLIQELHHGIWTGDIGPKFAIAEACGVLRESWRRSKDPRCMAAIVGYCDPALGSEILASLAKSIVRDRYLNDDLGHELESLVSTLERGGGGAAARAVRFMARVEATKRCPPATARDEALWRFYAMVGDVADVLTLSRDSWERHGQNVSSSRLRLFSIDSTIWSMRSTREFSSFDATNIGISRYIRGLCPDPPSIDKIILAVESYKKSK